MTNLVGIIKKDGQVVPFESDNVIVEFDSEFSKGNEILIHEPFNINRLVIYVKGDNNKILIGGGHVHYSLTIYVGHGSTVEIGKNFNCRHATFFIAEEPKLLIKIGDDCLFSSDIQLRTSDSHSIYSLENPRTPLNKAKRGIEIGDHCWIGHNVILLKDVTLENDVVVGMRSLLTQGIYKSSSIYAGSPARCIRSNIGWSGDNPSKLK